MRAAPLPAHVLCVSDGCWQHDAHVGRSRSLKPAQNGHATLALMRLAGISMKLQHLSLQYAQCVELGAARLLGIRLGILPVLLSMIMLQYRAEGPGTMADSMYRRRGGHAQEVDDAGLISGSLMMRKRMKNQRAFRETLAKALTNINTCTSILVSLASLCWIHKQQNNHPSAPAHTLWNQHV